MPVLSLLRCLVAVLAVGLVGVLPVRAQPSVLEDPAFEAEATRGLDLLYNMKFDEAAPIFDRLAARYPEHPVAPFLQALVPWWQILMDLSDTSHDDAFFDAMDEVIERSDRLLRRDRDNLDAKFFKGAALGFRGRLQSNRRRWLKAALDGKRALDYVLDVAEEDGGDNADFAFGKAIYDYYAAAVPERYSWSKPFVAMFPAGSKSRGLAAMHRTFREGSYLKAESAYFLLQIYYLYERDFGKSKQFIGWLRDEYPDNAFFHAMEGRILSRFGRVDEAERVFQAVMRRYGQGETGYNDAIAEQALYYLGRGQQLRQNHGQALALFYRLEQIAGAREQDSAFETLGRLRQGMSHDARGERQKALRRYREVLRLEDFAGSHDRARRYIDRPYGPRS
jgi:tetratricopeptide (TPR) repeat protein